MDIECQARMQPIRSSMCKVIQHPQNVRFPGMGIVTLIDLLQYWNFIHPMFASSDLFR